jgi:beta-N-acetylhexosaminidase
MLTLSTQRRFGVTLFTYAAIAPFLLSFASTKRPSIDEMLGQMLMVGFRGGANTDSQMTIFENIKLHHLGGVVLYSNDLARQREIRNVRDPEQLTKLVRKLKSSSLKHPLFVAVDQEGGEVRRLKQSFGLDKSPSAQELGKKDALRETNRQSKKAAGVLSRHGINFNLAPVVDLNINPNNPVIGQHGRSYGRNPGLVFRHARAFIDGHRSHGILTALKHFPGHGSSKDDSHRGIVDVTETWRQQELQPFKRLIRTKKADAIMLAHLYLRELDPRLPATLSPAIVGKMLRKDMGFDGVVMTDDLQMNAITQSFGEAEAAILAVKAGVDILLYANNAVYDDQIAQRILGHLRGALAQGRLTRSRIETSYRRILALKTRLD